MTYRSILTLVDGGPPTLEAAVVAADLAARFDARLTGVFPRAPLPASAWSQPVSWAMPPGVPPPIPQEILDAHERRTDALAEAARLAFEGTAGTAGCLSDWLTAPAATSAAVVSLMRRTDLTVLPRGALQTIGGGVSSADLVLGSGGPALLTSERSTGSTPGRRIVVAWNGGREAARAVRDAWPFLAIAETVHIVVVSPADAERPEGGLQRYFEQHGCRAEVVVVPREDAVAATVLLDQIKALRSDLVVMGLYGHSRLRETVLGGVSRSLFRECSVPMFVSH